MREVLRAVTKNAKETEKFAGTFAKEILKLKQKGATVIGLEGELGAGREDCTERGTVVPARA